MNILCNLQKKIILENNKTYVRVKTCNKMFSLTKI